MILLLKEKETKYRRYRFRPAAPEPVAIGMSIVEKLQKAMGISLPGTPNPEPAAITTPTEKPLGPGESTVILEPDDAKPQADVPPSAPAVDVKPTSVEGANAGTVPETTPEGTTDVPATVSTPKIAAAGASGTPGDSEKMTFKQLREDVALETKCKYYQEKFKIDFKLEPEAVQKLSLSFIEGTIPSPLPSLPPLRLPDSQQNQFPSRCLSLSYPYPVPFRTCSRFWFLDSPFLRSLFWVLSVLPHSWVRPEP